jgi:hypothetical protein
MFAPIGGEPLSLGGSGDGPPPTGGGAVAREMLVNLTFRRAPEVA